MADAWTELLALFPQQTWGSAEATELLLKLVSLPGDGIDEHLVDQFREWHASEEVSASLQKNHLLGVIGRRRSAVGRDLLLSLANSPEERAKDFLLWRKAVCGLTCYDDDPEARGIITAFLSKKEHDWNEQQAVEVVVAQIYKNAKPEQAYALLAPYVEGFFADKTSTPKVALRAVFDLKNTVDANKAVDPRWFDLLMPKFGEKADGVGELHHYIPGALALIPSPRRLDFWLEIHATRKDLGMIVLKGLASIKDDDERIVRLMRSHLGDEINPTSVAVAASALAARDPAIVNELKEPLLGALARSTTGYDAEMLTPIVAKVVDANDVKRLKEMVKAIKARPAETAWDKKARSGAAKAIDELAKTLKPKK